VGRPAGEVLRETPDIGFRLKIWGKVNPAVGQIIGRQEQSCPALADFHPKDEFEKHEGEPRILAKCRADNDETIKRLPSTMLLFTFPVRVSKYDFGAKAYFLSPGYSENVFATEGGRVFFHDHDWLLRWNGAGRGESAGVCTGPLLSQLGGNAPLKLTLPLPETDAKAFNDKLPSPRRSDGDPSVEIAFRLDGNSARDTIACNYRSPAAATGSVLAWRVVVPESKGIPARVLTDWISSDNWPPPAYALEDNRLFFGAPAEPKPEATECACSVAWKWGGAYGWFPSKLEFPNYDTCGSFENTRSFFGESLELDRQSLQEGKKAAAEIRAALDKLPGCKADKGQRQAMLKTLGRLEAALAVWEPVLAQENPSLESVNAANAKTCRFHLELRDKISTGIQEKFGDECNSKVGWKPCFCNK
jgi:hypothetical protein